MPSSRDSTNPSPGLHPVTGASETALTVPEFGGLLGRVASTRAGHVSDPPLDGIRLALATDLFEAAGQARDRVEADETEEAVRAIDGSLWMSAWGRAVSAASAALIDRLEQQFHDAACISRMPTPLLKRWLPTEAERLAITAHLGKGTGRLEQVLESLDQAVAALLERPDTGGALLTQWNAALDLSARRLEAAWIDLEEAVVREQQRWAVEIDNVRRWRRPQWPMWVATLALVAAAVYLGLVFGGFMEPPAVLRPAAEFFWEHL